MVYYYLKSFYAIILQFLYSIIEDNDDNINSNNNLKYYRIHTKKFIDYYIENYSKQFGCYILGIILWFALYGCFIYWKELLINHYKNKCFPNEGYKSVLNDILKIFKNMIFFSIIIIFIFFLLINTNYIGKEVLFCGHITILTIYLIIYITKYCILKHKFDYFDDLKFIYNYLIKHGSNSSLIKSHINSLKYKTE